ncbi:Exosome complex exonuclease RRP42 [Chionoecetes opilio]|uniref:Ribosomal RNA-processing protein 42 n=1 Tax=Chionoecetes opilio TaxID=41210 RepID=A0A8J5D2J3_CHIOP|nr:Exosome complex exonuclease RRP42 [Chionoecetes opilio]
MADITLSESEKRYIVDGVKLGLRVDGRERLDYQHMEIETGLVSTANGSARLRHGCTDVLVTVKMEMEPPPTHQPKDGLINFFVNCSANAAPEFEGRGGEDLATSLSAMLDGLYASPMSLDRSRLCVVPGKYVKVLYVDVEILECGGSLFDTVSLGVKAALYATRMPKIYITGEDGGEMEFMVSENPQEVDRVDVSNAPILITHLRITENLTIVDPSPEEECCGPVQVVVGVNPKGLITATQQFGAGTFAPQTLADSFKSASALGVKIHQQLMQRLQQEENVPNRKIRGFW